MPVSETLASFTHLPPDVQKHLEALETYIGDTDGKDTVMWCSEPPDTCVDGGTIDASEAVTAFNGIVASLAALSDQVVGWQPIETAPKDGTRISLFAEGCLASGEGVVIGHWYVHPNIAGWITDAFDCGDYEFNPTLWQPLPTPPQPSEDNGPDTNGGET